MFKRAVDSHQQNVLKEGVAQQFSSSSRPVQGHLAFSSQSTPRRKPSGPLSVANVNVVRPGASHTGSATRLNSGTKRSASCFEKAFSGRDAFDDSLYPDISMQANSQKDAYGYRTTNAATRNEEVYFDENDFDSDVDLDIEDPATKGHVKYPELPPIPQHHSLPTVHSTPDEPYPGWSSSPVEQFRRSIKPSLQQFAYQRPNDAVIRRSSLVEQHQHSKRRKLPWNRKQEEEEMIEAAARPDRSDPARHSAFEGGQSFFTPLPKKTEKSSLPWNTTASAIKEQQKQLRQANKKLTKTNEGTEEDIQASIANQKKQKFHKVFLSQEQQLVLNLVIEQKRSVFFTGSAGTGKSVLLREIVSGLRAKYKREPDRVAVTASTGLAACNVGGITLHSFAGIGLGKEDVPTLAKKIRKNQKARHRWMRTKVLIVDEISMVDGQLFDKLEEIARLMRNNGRPFGGIQLVITGDFFQLPPVPDRNTTAQFAFEAGTWNTSIEHTIGLHHVFRQKDPVFAGMLNEMREGRLTPQSIARFRTLQRDLTFEDQLDATELFPTRNEVENANTARMRNLQGEIQTYEARDGGSIQDIGQRDKLLSNCLAPAVIQVKKGAQVMLIKNIDETLVNGSQGKIIGFMSEQLFDNYQQNEGEYYASQRGAGSTNNHFDPAAVVGDLSANRSKVKDLGAASTTQHYPVVRFKIADGTTRDLLCQRESWKVELPSGEVQASRSQIPLILAWALSIHKAQGLTLERVKVDLGKVFEKGQAYVALSRATSMQGLQICRFDPKKVVAHESVRAFYSKLSRAEAAVGEGGVTGDDNYGAKGVKKVEATRRASSYERALAMDDEWEI